MEITRGQFDEHRRPRFGVTNPERMRLAFWEWMIRGEDPPARQEGVFGAFGLMIRNGILKSGYGPWRARDHFNVPMNREDGPIWTFERMGATRTRLPDGRVVCVGGEHEDFYDPDFSIYNDVVVIDPTDRIEIFGYPRDVFPPTDFHTATLDGDRILVVGCLGNPDDRHPGHTPVYSLDLSGYRISEVMTTGEMPGWLFGHEADFDSAGVLTIRGGEVFEERNGAGRIRRNVEEYTLDIRSLAWRRLTNRNWRQFTIRMEDRGGFVLEKRPEGEALLPRAIEHTVLPCEDTSCARFAVGGVPVSVTVGVGEIEVLVEGDLPDDLAARVAEDIRTNAEAVVQSRCLLEQV